MRNRTSLIIGLFVTLVLVAYMVAYQVRYDQAVVVTTFGSADENSVVTTPGLKPKWPWPIQNTYAYSTRVQLLEEQLGEQQTADGSSVVVRTYVAWRITDPLKFFKTLKTVEEAESKLKALSENVRGEFGRYRFDQIVNIDASKLRLKELEQGATQKLAQKVQDQGYGIQIEQVGVRRLVLTESVTATVFERMKKERQRMAQAARSEGEAAAGSIRSEAEKTRQSILAFADRSAEAIRAEGQQEAAKYYQTFAQEEEFAIFLRKIESLPKILSNNTTYLFDANSITPVDLLSNSPDQGR